MDAEEDVQYFRLLRPGLDPPQVIVLFQCAERALHRGRPHPGKFLSDKSEESIRLKTTRIFDSKLEATCSSWPKLGQVDPSWSVLPTCLAGVHGGLHGCSRSRVSGAGHPPSIHVD